MPHVAFPSPLSPHDGLRGRPTTIVRRDDNANNGGRKGGAQGGRNCQHEHENTERNPKTQSMETNPMCRRIGRITQVKHLSRSDEFTDAEIDNLRRRPEGTKPNAGLGQIAGRACQTGGQDDRDDLCPRRWYGPTHGHENGHEHRPRVMMNEDCGVSTIMIMTAHGECGTPPPPPPPPHPTPTLRRTGGERAHTEDTARIQELGQARRQ